MRFLLVLLLALVSSADATAAGKRGRCLAPADASAVVQRQRLQQPRNAIAAARRKASGELLAARLCETGSGYVYRLHILAKNGHVTRVVVDAKSAEIIGVH
jgi:uncharacterized membrane protein YkoI